MLVIPRPNFFSVLAQPVARRVELTTITRKGSVLRI